MAGESDFEKAMKNFKRARKGGDGSSNSGFSMNSILAFVILVLILIGGFSCFYTIEPDEEAVVLRLGKFTKISPPGLHFKIPFGIDQLRIRRTKAVHQLEFGFRTKRTGGKRTEYSQKNYDHESLMLTGDLNVADVEWVVQYQISDLYKFLFRMKNPRGRREQNIRDIAESVMRRVVGDRPVNAVLTTGRQSLASEVKLLMQELLDQYDVGIRITTVELQDVNPPESVKASFNEVNAAKQEQENFINQAEKRFNKVIPEARGKAEQKIAKAQGYADALIQRSQGDAGKFLAIARAYRKDPQITQNRLYIETMERIFGRMKELIIVDSKIKGLLPLFQGKEVK